jgi:hypothetical protein
VDRARRRTLAIAAAILAILLLISFLIARTGSTPTLVLEDYLTEKARELKFDANRIARFVRDEVAADRSYRGALRGAVGTLWAGSGDDLDRAGV